MLQHSLQVLGRISYRCTNLKRAEVVFNAKQFELFLRYSEVLKLRLVINQWSVWKHCSLKCVQEIAEPLYHLKQAMEQLSASQTFRHILATVLAIGNFLNGCKVSLWLDLGIEDLSI